MKLTPLDIRKQDFDRSLRGYDPDEVEAFLDMVATQWEEMVDEQRQLEKKVEELEGQMEHYRKVEEALQEALDQTRENAEKQLENAREKAENIVQEAKAEAKEIRRAAKAERDRLEGQTENLRSRRSEVVARLRAFLNSELEILREYDRESGSTETASEEAEGEAEEPGFEGAADPSESVETSGPGAPVSEPPAPDLPEVAEEPTETDVDEQTAEGRSTPAVDESARPVDETTDESEPGGSETEGAASRASVEEPTDSGQETEQQAPPSDVFTDDVASESGPDPRPEQSPQGESGEQRLTGSETAEDSSTETPAASDDHADVPEVEPTGAAETEDIASSEEAGEEDKKRSRKDDEKDATSEEIEKIWSILEDME